MSILKYLKHFKLDQWWNYKIGNALFSFLLIKFLYTDNLTHFYLEDGMLLFVFILLIFLGFGINDYTDYQQDHIAKKRNVFNVILLKIAPAYLVTLAILATFTCILFLKTEVILLFILLMLMNIFYSCQPFRFKDKKYLSIIITGLYERALPYSIIILHVLLQDKQPITPLLYLFIFVYILWSFVWETRNYINGQLEDTETDEKSGVKLLIKVKGSNGITQIKKDILTIEITLFLAWLSSALFLNQNLWIIVAGVILIPLFHYVIQGKSIGFNKFENLVDYINNFTLLFPIIVIICWENNKWIPFVSITYIIFLSSYSKDSIIKIGKIGKVIGMKIYNLIQFTWLTISRVVNYSIYYFRKYILKWEEERCRGMKNRIIYLHIPHTVTTTFTEMVEQQFPSENIFTVKRNDNANINTHLFLKLDTFKKEKIYHLNGQIQFGVHQEMVGEVKYITFLRDPIERIVSLYHDVKQNKNLELSKLIAQNNWNLYDFVKNVNLNNIHNGQLKLISGMEGTDDEMMEIALENIQNHFSFVGLVEFFDESLQRLNKLYGWDTQKCKELHSKQHYVDLNEIDEKTISLIKERNYGDIMLYHQIKTSFLANKP